MRTLGKTASPLLLNIVSATLQPRGGEGEREGNIVRRALHASLATSPRLPRFLANFAVDCKGSCVVWCCSYLDISFLNLKIVFMFAS